MAFARRTVLTLPTLAAPALAQPAALHCAVGPFQPTAGDTRRTYEPFFAHLAVAVGRTHQLIVTTDWAGIAVAVANGQVDCAWMGPWGYVLAKNRANAEALALVQYQGRPTYQAIILAPRTHHRALSRRCARDVHFLRQCRLDQRLADPAFLVPHLGIDPRTYFRYRDGASHPGNVLAVANGQVDLATDYDRNFAAILAARRVGEAQARIVWRSDPLPNDALAVRGDLDSELKAALTGAAIGLDAATTQRVMPPNYTGWEAARPDSYALIETAGRAMGRIGGG